MSGVGCGVVICVEGCGLVDVRFGDVVIVVWLISMLLEGGADHSCSMSCEMGSLDYGAAVWAGDWFGAWRFCSGFANGSRLVSFEVLPVDLLEADGAFHFLELFGSVCGGGGG